MAPPRLLIDTDIFILLAGADLLDQAVAALGFQLADCRYLPALPPMLRRGSLTKRHSAQVLQKVALQCARMQALDEAPSAELLDQLTNKPQVDPGEAILYGLLAERPLYLLASNDKRAMEAIATMIELATIRRSVAGRVICLETILMHLSEEFSVADLATSFALMMPYNSQLTLFFSPGCIANPDEYQRAVQSYYDQLVRKVGADFLWQGV